MSETLLSGRLDRETDFVLVPGVGRVFGTCGPNALHGALTNALGRYVGTVEVYQHMRAAGLCAPSGASTADALLACAKSYGVTIAEYRGYGEPWPSWQSFINRHIGTSAIVFETALGQALHDEITGAGENAVNLQYHYACIYGRHDGGMSARAGRVLPAGYWVADGASFAGGNSNANNFNASNTLQFYSDTTLAAAQLCASIAIVGQRGTPTVSIPTGWLDDGTTLSAGPSDGIGGGVVVHGFRDFILADASWDPRNVPIGGEYSDNAGGSRQDFRWSRLAWESGKAIWEIADARGQCDTLRSAAYTAKAQAAAVQHLTDAVQAKLDTAVAMNIKYLAQISDLQAQLAAAIAGQHVDPQAQAALDALRAFSAALKGV